MKLLLIAAIGAAFMSPVRADVQTLVEATSSQEAAIVIRAAKAHRPDLIVDAVGLGAADPVELVFELISPQTPSVESEMIAGALTSASPRRADEVAASAAIAADVTSNEARLVGLIAALLAALDSSPLDEAARQEEVREVLAALLSVTDEGLRLALANAVARGDGAALLASLGEGPETAAVTPPVRPFGDAPVGLTLTPGSAAQDAPSAN